MIKARVIRCHNCNELATIEVAGESTEIGQPLKWKPICVRCLVKLQAEETKAEMEFVGASTFESLPEEIRAEYEAQKKKSEDFVLKARRELEAEDKRKETTK